MTAGKYLSGKDDLSQVYELREAVFQKELGLTPQLERDGCDDMAVHVLVYEDQKPVATGRILYDGEIFKISRVAVLPEYRKRQYGDFVVRMLINKALLSGAGEIYASTLLPGRRLFEKIGFEVCGTAYEDGGLSYLPMWLKKEKLHKCCGCG